ncbi:hypothetical protein WJX73_003566 [Symbiochloris irregularis]|uniref:PPM-type phosphatase domain-containing protein n=1 Tax=Symbiochloris irregularis TaxID=706552 RepID=A0AAW1NU76_9CHLO
MTVDYDDSHKRSRSSNSTALLDGKNERALQTAIGRQSHRSTAGRKGAHLESQQLTAAEADNIQGNGTGREDAPFSHDRPSKRKVPKDRLSFGEELDDDTDDDAQPTFNLTASTSARFRKERTLAYADKVSSVSAPSEFPLSTLATRAEVPAPLAPRSLGPVSFGIAQSRGLRPYMEDYAQVIASFQLVNRAGATVSDGVVRSFAGVFDGHNGALAAEHACRRLHKLLAADAALERCTGEPGASPAESMAAVGALERAFLAMDSEILQACKTTQPPQQDGSTCLVLLRIGESLWAAHAGDSRAVMSRGGHGIRLTQDHKPLPFSAEADRVRAAGGSVENAFGWRVVGPARGDRKLSCGLAVSRALGDLDFKEPQRLVESRPEVSHYGLQPGDAFVIAASDGLWDVLSDQRAVDIAQAVLAVVGGSSYGSSQPSRATDTLARAAADALLAEALAAGSQDNITVVLMLLQWD